MTKINPTSIEFIRDVDQAKKYLLSNIKSKSKHKKGSSSLALLYERARNAVELREENLIRTSAIERILKRRIFLNEDSQRISKLLVKELSWAKYLDSEPSGVETDKKLSDLIQKYTNVMKMNPSYDRGQIISILASEVENLLSSNHIDQVMINYIHQTLVKKISINESEENKNIQVYIAVERAFAKSTDSIITYKLLKVMAPDWTDQEVFFNTLEKIKTYLNHPSRDQIKRKVNGLMPPFNLLYVMVKKYVENENYDIKKVIEEKDKFNELLESTLNEKYKETKDKLIRASKRSIIYIFLTKMILALLIEVPVEILLGEINYTVLLINILFPPSMMILLNMQVKLPSSNNTSVMIDKINNYIYYNDDSNLETITLENKSGKFDKTFLYLFTVSSIVVLLGIIFLLTIIGFSFISQIIFMFFLSVVSFFAFRVREITKEYELSEYRDESFLETILDYIFLPIVKMGQYLSNQISRLNIISFVFDFIIEAPLKSFLEILEGWLHFVRVKREEILS